MKQIVEDYLNGRSKDIPAELDSGNDAQNRFLRHTVKRLMNTYDLYCRKECGQDDFLLALRDYLLVSETDLELNNLIVPENNMFGIVRDYENDRYFASFQFPQYTNYTLAQQAFLRNIPDSKRQHRNYNLCTDSFIHKITGYTAFKSMAQKLAVYGALNTPDGFTTLVSLPTGGGKSLITQTISYQKDGLTIVVVPTVSLAIDQVRVAKNNIRSENIENEVFSYSSGVNPAPILQAIREKTAKLLFISPEALINNPGFETVINEVNLMRYLKNIVIDEAHIVVDWGDLFRIDYQCLESWRKKLMLKNPSIRTVLLSATYEERSVSLLKQFFSQGEKWIEIRCDSLRHEPRYMFVRAKSNSDKKKKMLEMVRKMPHPMIIYVARPTDAFDLVQYLKEHGIENVKSFTGLTNRDQRRILIDEWVDDQAHISAEIQRKKAEVKSAPTAKGLRYSIVTLVCFLVFVASLITASLVFSNRSESRKDEDVNENSYDHYVRSNYHVIGDETIFEHDGLSIKITGFYEESRTSSFSPMKIEFTVENNTGEKQRVVMKTAGMNGISDHYYLFVYDTFDPGTTVFYEKAYNVPGNAISEIIFNRISMESKDYTKRYEVKDCIRVKTSAVVEDIDIEPEGNLIYSSDLVDVYSKDTEDHRGYSLYVQNKSEHDFTIDSDNMLIDGKKIDYNVIYDMAVPAGYLFHEEHIRVHDESFDGYENKEVKISISFKCDKDPSLDFSTGYIELK